MTNSILRKNTDSHKQLNIETRIANRARSIFASVGTIISDFYLEAGIYFVGGFNALLVGWDIYTDMLTNNQPLPYAIVAAFIAFIAVEGLAVYLVGAAAKTNNSLLWFFSVIFASFFTYAHYQEMATGGGIIAQYITLAIPFFVVIGYWARTVKTQVESDNQTRQAKAESETAYQREIEAKKLDHQMALERERQATNERVRLAKIEAQTGGHVHMTANGQNQGQNSQTGGQTGDMSTQRAAKKEQIEARQSDVLTLLNVSPELAKSPTNLARQLKAQFGHDVSPKTVSRDLKEIRKMVTQPNGKVK